jgi:SAM-dependent methyltransferase
MSREKSNQSMFSREDESDDSLFYAEPRFEKHIDEQTIDAITDLYRQYLVPDSNVLDLMSSWISHLPEEMVFQKVCGLGMNLEELRRNPRLHDFVVQDLNLDPVLPYPESSFDAVLIAVSVQYLTKPVEVFKSIGRVLKPGGYCIVSTSHRLFPTKAIRAFMVLPATQRCALVASYFNYTGLFESPLVLDKSPEAADPLWVVLARKH